MVREEVRLEVHPVREVELVVPLEVQQVRQGVPWEVQVLQVQQVRQV